MQGAEKVDFQGHECRPYIDRNLAPQALDFLDTAEKKFLEKYK